MAAVLRVWGDQWRIQGRGPGDPGSPLFLDQTAT